MSNFIGLVSVAVMCLVFLGITVALIYQFDKLINYILYGVEFEDNEEVKYEDLDDFVIEPTEE